MSWLLDTDVICQPAKRQGDARVVAWLHQERDQCFTSAIVIAQLAYWVRSKEGRQRIELQDWLRRLIDAGHKESTRAGEIFIKHGAIDRVPGRRYSRG